MRNRFLAHLLIVLCAAVIGCRRNNASSPDLKPRLLQNHPILGSVREKFEDCFELCEIIQLSSDSNVVADGLSTFDVDEKGFILAGNPSSGKQVFLFAPSGSLIARVGKKGAGADEYLVPLSVCFGGLGELLVYDLGQKKVIEYDRSGESRRTHVLGKLFTKMRTDPRGSLLLFTSIGYSERDVDATIFKYGSNGRFQCSFMPRSELFTHGGAVLGGGIATDSYLNIYAMSPYEYRISVFDEDGNLLKKLEPIPPSYYRPLKKPTENPQKSLDALSTYHKTWTHLVNFQLYNDSLLLVFSQDWDKGKPSYFLDIYDVNGRLYQSGLRCSILQAAYDAVSRGVWLYLMTGEEGHDSILLKYRLR